MAESVARILLEAPTTYLLLQPRVNVGRVMAKHDVVAGTVCLDVVVIQRAVHERIPKPRVELQVRQGPFHLTLVTYRDKEDDVAMWNGLQPGELITVQGELQNWNGKLLMVTPYLAARDCEAVWPIYERNSLVRWSQIGVALQVPDQSLQKVLQASACDTEAALLEAAGIKSDSLLKVLRAGHRPASLEEASRGQRAINRLAHLIKIVG
ncbi:MAG: hypothetical protein KGZ68_16760 [Dechloromonas sp.]|nr:hypothetical protein [Dechloromonas sp.]